MPTAPLTPPLVLLHLWGVGTRDVPGALVRMGSQRRALRTGSAPGLRFAKLLGTGDGRTFTVRDADMHHWAVLTVWDDEDAGDRFAAESTVVRSWQRIADETLTVRLRPLAARGRWSGREPFGDPLPRKAQGPVASITRARIATRRAAVFWRSVPPVSADLQQVNGLRLAVGIGEAPVGLQGTFSLWDSAAQLNDFAHRRAPHVDAIARTATEGWYAEELFARFEVLGVEGTYRGRPV